MSAATCAVTFSAVLFNDTLSKGFDAEKLARTQGPSPVTVPNTNTLRTFVLHWIRFFCSSSSLALRSVFRSWASRSSRTQGYKNQSGWVAFHVACLATKKRLSTKFSSKNFKGRCTDEWIILWWIFKTCGGRSWNGCRWLRICTIGLL